METRLSSYLGTYTYKNGYTSLASCIGAPEEGIKVTGVELIIPLFPDTKDEWTGCGEVSREEKWTLILVQHSGNKLRDAADVLSRTFSSGIVVYTPASSTTKSYPMIRVTFKRYVIMDLEG